MSTWTSSKTQSLPYHLKCNKLYEVGYDCHITPRVQTDVEAAKGERDLLKMIQQFFSRGWDWKPDLANTVWSLNVKVIWPRLNRKKWQKREHTLFPTSFCTVYWTELRFFALPLILLFQQCFETQNTLRRGSCLKLIRILLPSPTLYHYFFPSSWFLSVWRETFESWYRCLICRL